MNKTIIVRRNYVHYIKKYARYDAVSTLCCVAHLFWQDACIVLPVGYLCSRPFAVAANSCCTQCKRCCKFAVHMLQKPTGKNGCIGCCNAFADTRRGIPTFQYMSLHASVSMMVTLSLSASAGQSEYLSTPVMAATTRELLLLLQFMAQIVLAASDGTLITSNQSALIILCCCIFAFAGQSLLELMYLSLSCMLCILLRSDFVSESFLH